MKFRIHIPAMVLGLMSLSDSHAASIATEFVSFGAAGKALTPQDDTLGASWTTSGFDDSSWISGPSPFGFGYQADLDLAEKTDLRVQMQGINASTYLRFEFTLADPATVETLALDIYLDDGFTAYLNGIAVASENAPSFPTWNSRAESGGEAFFNAPSSYNLDQSISHLIQGDNVLAIHGMNASMGSSDFLIAPILRGTVNGVPEPRAITLLGLAALLAVKRSRN